MKWMLISISLFLSAGPKLDTHVTGSTSSNFIVLQFPKHLTHMYIVEQHQNLKHVIDFETDA